MIPHRGGLPHSDTWGSKPARGSPQIFAACHVLHRLLAPRHPPDALLMLTHTRRPKPACPNPAMHRTHPHPNANPGATPPSHSKAILTQHTLLTTPLNTATTWHLGPNTAHAASNTQVRQPMPNRHGPPAPASNRTTAKAVQPKPPETPCAPRDAPEPDSQSIKNTTPRTARATPHPTVVTHPMQSEPNLSVTTPNQYAHLGTHATPNKPWRRNTMEADGIEPTTSCLQSRRSPN